MTCLRHVTLLAATLLLTAACGGSADTSAASTTPPLSNPGGTLAADGNAATPKAPAPASPSARDTLSLAATGNGNPATTTGDGVLAYPDDQQMTLLAYRLTDRTPPLAEWAAQQNSVRTADEFTRDQRLRTETDLLAAMYASTDGVGFLQLRLRSRLSQYDSTRHGYYLTAFAPGGSFGFGGREPVEVRLENAGQAYFWQMDTARAKEVLDLVGHGRQVTVDAKIRLAGTERRTSGLVIKGRIVEYTILGTRSNDERILASFRPE